MDDEQLINMVQQNPIIFNKFCGGYRLPSEKMKAWIKISGVMGTTTDNCIKRWKALREKYYKTKTMLVISSGSGQQMDVKWHLYDAMSFLDPFIIPRPTRSSANVVAKPQLTCLPMVSSSLPTTPVPFSPVFSHSFLLSPSPPLLPLSPSPNPVSTAPLSPAPLSPAPLSPAPLSPAPLSPDPLSPAALSPAPLFSSPSPTPSSSYS